MEKKNSALKKQIAREFDYFIKQKHCKPNGGKMQLKAMCESCRRANYNQLELEKIKEAVLNSF